MNDQMDLSFLKVLTENPEFIQKALSIASSLSSSGILSGINPNGARTESFPHDNQFTQNQIPNLNQVLSQNTERPSEPSDIFQSAPNHRKSENGETKRQQENTSDQEKKPSQKNSRAGHGERIRLLEAMRPFVPDERRDKLDFIIRLMGLIQIADKLGLKHIIEGR